MDPVAIAKSIADLGGWGAFLALVVLIGIGLMKRWWVMGWMYDRLEARAEKSDIQAERNDEALKTSSDAYSVMAKAYDRLERDLDRLSSRSVKRD